MTGGGAGPETGGTSTASRIGVGCFTTFVGFWSGGMIGALVAKIVGGVQHCAAGENGQPCNWHIYAFIGMIVGAISLPSIALWRMRSSRSTQNPD